MRRRDRKRDILEMALKESGVQKPKLVNRNCDSALKKCPGERTNSTKAHHKLVILSNEVIVPSQENIEKEDCGYRKPMPLSDPGIQLLTSSVPHVTSDLREKDILSDLFSSSTADATTAIRDSPEPNTYLFISPEPKSLLTNYITETGSDIPISSTSDVASDLFSSFLSVNTSDFLTTSMSATDAVSEHFNCSAPDSAKVNFTSSAPDAITALTCSDPEAETNLCISSVTGNDVDVTSVTNENSMPTVLETSFPSISELTRSNNNSPSVKLSEKNINTRKSKQSVDVRPCKSSATDDTTNAHSYTLRTAHPTKKSAYLDYMSDDEVALLNAFGNVGSSDEWEPEVSGKKKKKLSIDPKDEFVGDRKEKKKKVNKRKDNSQKRISGHSYTKTNGKVCEEKKVQPNPCAGKKCGHNCGNITEERRLSIFNHFWSLTEQRRKDWIISLTQKTSIKRKRSKDSEKRNTTYKYNITDGESHRQVCLQFFCHTLDVTHKYIFYTVSTADQFGCSKESQRGKNVPPNKTNNDDLVVVENYIKSLPAVPSHYCRKDSTRVYLPAEYKNLSNLYRKYKEHRRFQGLNFVSECVFRKIFKNSFNIAFHIPKKDKCLKCSRFENLSDPTCDEKLAHEEHLAEKEHTYRRYKMHKSIHKTDPASICISFDLQKVLNTPYGDSMLLFYSRKVSVYNAVVYENGTRNVFCYYWDESQGNRGANEISTILRKYITDLDDRGNIKRLLLYCDCCPGQNRNKIVLAMLNETVQRCKNIESIQINFLLTGHSYMTVDSAHATIENQVKNTTIWAPSQWYTVFQTARQNPKPFDVEKLNHADFKKWDVLADKYFVGNLVGKISKIRVATFKKNRTLATVKYSMDPEAPEHRIEVVSKTKFFDLPDCYPTPLQISESKHKDLMKLCTDKVIPQQFQGEYFDLTFSKKVKDCLPESDIEDDQ